MAVNIVTIVTDLNWGDHVYNWKRYNLYQTNQIFNQNRAKLGKDDVLCKR